VGGAKRVSVRRKGVGVGEVGGRSRRWGGMVRTEE